MGKQFGKKKKLKSKAVSPFKNYWTKENYLILLIGFAVLIIGYFLMGQDPYDNPLSLSVSPIVLLIAYIVIFPLAIFYRKKKNESGEDVPSES